MNDLKIQPGPADAKAPAQPDGVVSPDVANGPEVESVQPDSAVAREKASAEVALGIAEAGLEDNKFSRVYIETKKLIEENPNMQGPLSKFILALLKTGAIGMGFAVGHIAPFVKKSLDEDPKYKDLRFTPKELNALARGEVHEAKALVATENWKEQQANSTKYACELLGIDPVTHPLALQAKVWHSSTPIQGGGEAKYYSETNVAGVSKNGMQAGTIIFVSRIDTGATPEELMKSPRMVYVATGNGMECEGYDPKKGGKVTYNLEDLFSSDSDDSGLFSMAKFSSFVYTPNFKKGGQKTSDK